MATLQQVADRAGVSVTTVSLVLNGKVRGGRVSAECVDRVRGAAADLNYVSNYHARSMKVGRAEAVAVSFDIGHVELNDDRSLPNELELPYFGQLIGNVEAALRQHSYALTIVTPSDGERAPDRGLLGVLQRRFDGLLVVGAVSFVERTRLFRDAPLEPIVILDYAGQTALPTVNTDNAAAVKLAIDHLAGLGHKSLLWVGPARVPWMHESTPGSRELLLVREAWNLGLRLVTTDCGPLDGAGGSAVREFEVEAAARRVAARLADGPRDFTAVVCYNDNIAVGVLDALADAGVRVPADVSVVGFDDAEGRRTRPRLTSVNMSLDRLARLGVERLLELIEAPERIKTYRGTVERVAPRLEVRASTGPALLA